MNISVIKSYIINSGIGAAGGAVCAVFLKNFQVWRSPNSGLIACLFAERVAANPWHKHMGFTLAGSATIPADYIQIGQIVPTMCKFRTLLVSSIAIGILIGAVCTFLKNPNSDKS